jgi:hypothetical protein
MQQQLLDFAQANPSPVSVASILRAHLAQRPFWSYRAFRTAIGYAMEKHDIMHCTADKEFNFCKGTISRAIAGRSIEPVAAVAAALGYFSPSATSLDAVFKLKRQMETA